MFELIKLEWIKLCRKRLTIAVTLFCVVATSIIFCLPFLQYQIWDETWIPATHNYVD